jgi:Fe-S cluster assembly iron-binding protein IscA
MIQITNKAHKELQEILNNKEMEDSRLRVFIAGFG